MVTRAQLEEQRRRAHRDIHEMLTSGPRAKSAAARMYPHLTNDATRSQVKANWQEERKKPAKRFKRKPFKRGAEE